MFLFSIVKEDLMKSLEITWKGILAIFIVIALIIAAVTILNIVTVKMENAKKQKEEAKRLAAEQAAQANQNPPQA